jgi:hypothetical protein
MPSGKSTARKIIQYKRSSPPDAPLVKIKKVKKIMTCASIPNKKHGLIFCTGLRILARSGFRIFHVINYSAFGVAHQQPVGAVIIICLFRALT